MITEQDLHMGALFNRGRSLVRIFDSTTENGKEKFAFIIEEPGEAFAEVVKGGMVHMTVDALNYLGFTPVVVEGQLKPLLPDSRRPGKS